VNVRKCVPYQACRKVCKNVCCQEKVRVCKMVPRCVEKEVPCAPACQAPACNAPCGPACGGCDTGTCCSDRVGLLDRLKGRLCGLRDHLRCRKANDCCDTGCGAAASCGAAACCN
jgi:hypothetical protein